MIPSANFDNTNFIDFTASSFAGIGISTRFGSQFVSKFEIIGIFHFSRTAELTR